MKLGPPKLYNSEAARTPEIIHYNIIGSPKLLLALLLGSSWGGGHHTTGRLKVNSESRVV